MKRMPWCTAAVVAAAAAAYLLPGGFELMCYSRTGILAGEWWRLWTGHLVHGSWPHFIWNVIAFIILGVQVEPRMGGRYPAFLAASALGIGGGLLLSLPGLDTYSGLSGLDTALFGWLAAEDMRQARLEGDVWPVRLNALWLVGLLGKIVYEVAFGRALFAYTPGLPPVPLAHALGVLAAFIWLTPGKPLLPAGSVSD